MILNITDLSYAYEQEKMILDGVNFKLNENEWIGILGASGGGKTTLLKCLCGLELPNQGAIVYNENTKFEFMRKKRNKLQKNDFQRTLEEMRQNDIGIILQDYALISCLSVLENIAFSLEIKKVPKEEALELAESYINKFHLEQVKDKYPNHLSGGEKQRTAIARAMIKQPRLLLADEPTGNLDAKNAKEVWRMCAKIKEKTSIVMVTHDLVAASYCDRVLILKEGKIEKTLSKQNKTKQVYMQELIESVCVEDLL